MALTDKQTAFIEAVKEGKNVFLTGKAGKSFVVKEALSRVKTPEGLKIIVNR